LNTLSTEQQNGLEIEISGLNKELGKMEFLGKAKVAVEMWKSQNKIFADNIVKTEQKENALEKYITEQVNLINEIVNSKFTNGITWALQNFVYRGGDGGYEEECTLLYQGKRYESLSTGEKNIANLETLKVLQNFYGVNIVIFADNNESVTIPYAVDRQIVELYAQKGKKIENFIKITDLY
jgi:hypothetical protein